MRSLDVIIVHSDKESAQKLANSLHQNFRSVQVVNSIEEFRSAISRKRVRLAIVDLETISLEHVGDMQHEFGVSVVCTHRIPDEKMWAEALDLGAVDCCQTLDVQAILQTVNRNVLARTKAA